MRWTLFENGNADRTFYLYFCNHFGAIVQVLEGAVGVPLSEHELQEYLLAQIIKQLTDS